MFAPDAHQRLGHAHDAARHRLPRLGAGTGHPRFVRKRGRRDAAVDATRQERLQDSDQVERVVDPGIVTPVRRVDVGLDRRAVERSVGEAVDDGDVQPFAVEERAKLAQPIALEQLARLARRQPQPDAKRRRRREARLERRRVRAQVREHALPAVGGVDVRAVGEVEGALVDMQCQESGVQEFAEIAEATGSTRRHEVERRRTEAVTLAGS